MEHCRICAKDFATRRNLRKHNRKVHKIFVGRPKNIRQPKNICRSTPSLYECSECPSVKFSTKKELMRHIRVHKRQSEGGRRLMCPECDEIAQHYVDLRSHITEIHNIELTTEEITFNNAEDFIRWKHDIEENQPSSYVLNCGRKRMLDGSSSEYYICHRSYGFRSSRTSNSTERKRRLKSSGSNKIGKACPAGFSVKKYVDGRIIVKICSTHIGHSQSLGDIFLNQEDRDQIAGKLHDGVEVERILAVSNEKKLGVCKFERTEVKTSVRICTNFRRV